MASEHVLSRGRSEPDPPQQIGTRYVNLIGKSASLASATSAAPAAPAAATSAAATSTASAAMKAAPASAASAAAASATASATPRKFFAERGLCVAFPV